MEKRALVAFALSLLVLLAWGRFFAPRPPVPVGDPAAGEISLPLADRVESPPVLPAEHSEPEPAREAGSSGLPEPIVAADRQERIRVETPEYILTLDNRGGVVTSWILKDYTDQEGNPLEVVSPAARRLDSFPLSLHAEDAGLDERINAAVYSVDKGRVTKGDSVFQRISFRYADGAGLVIEKVLEVGPGYLSRFQVRTVGPGGPLPLTVQLGPGFGIPTEEKEKSRFYVRGQAVLLKQGGGLTTIDRSRLKTGELRRETGAFQWGGIQDTYFSALLIPEQGTIPEALVRSYRVVDQGRERNYLTFTIPLAGERTDFSLFVGPKDLDILTPLGHGLPSVVDFGKWMAPIARVLLVALKFINQRVGNFGWSIVILTVAIKLLFFPLTQRSSVSMRRMQLKMKKVQPRVKAIKERQRKHRKDSNSRQKMNQEMMELYKKEGINPLGSMSGCLPMLLQLPVLLGLYRLLSVAIELRHAPFLFWLTDLSQKDQYYVTPIIMGLSMFLQQMLNTPVGIDPAQRRMMMMMPLVFTFFFVNFPSGLVLYWLVNNILGIAQQYLVNQQVERMEGKELGARNGKLQGVSR